MIRRARTSRRPRVADDAETGPNKEVPEDGIEQEPEVNGSRYRPLWQPHDVPAAMRSILSDDVDYFDFSGRETADLITTLIPSPEAVVVDLGCGIGRVARHLAPKCGLLWAVDVSPRMLELAEQWLCDVPNIRLSLCHDDHVPEVPDASADFVYSVFVLQHVEREDAFLLLREIRRMLRPGGCALLSFPNLQSDVYLASFIAYAESGEAAVNRARARMYVPEEVTRLVTAAGLAIVEMASADHIDVLARRPHDAEPGR